MPGGDRTGPLGMGPMTGRGAGFCGGAGMPGFGRGAGGQSRGARGRRGWRNRFYATGLTGWQRAAMETAMSGAEGDAPPEMPNADQGPELEALRRQADSLSKELEAIRQRIDRLPAQPPATSAPPQG